MNSKMIEQYFLLFTDTLTSNLVICLNDHMVFEAMRIFGSYDLSIVLSTVCIAWCCASCLNYVLGCVVHNIFKIESDSFMNTVDSIHKFMRRFHWSFCIAVSMVAAIPPFGKFAIFFIGLSKLNFRMILLLSIFFKASYYAYLLFA